MGLDTGIRVLRKDKNVMIPDIDLSGIINSIDNSCGRFINFTDMYYTNNCCSNNIFGFNGIKFKVFDIVDKTICDEILDIPFFRSFESLVRHFNIGKNNCYFHVLDDKTISEMLTACKLLTNNTDRKLLDIIDNDFIHIFGKDIPSYMGMVADDIELKEKERININILRKLGSVLETIQLLLKNNFEKDIEYIVTFWGSY